VKQSQPFARAAGPALGLVVAVAGQDCRETFRREQSAPKTRPA